MSRSVSSWRASRGGFIEADEQSAVQQPTYRRVYSQPAHEGELHEFTYRWVQPACAVGITHDGARTADRLQDAYNSDTPAHFLRILSMAFPLASSSTSLSR